MKRYLFLLAKHAALVKLLIVLAVIVAIALAGAAPDSFDP
jgi:hypothetical protein